MTVTFAALRRAALKSGNDAALAVLAEAETNATDTVFIEKAADETEVDTLALASIAFCSSFTDDRKVQRWFERNGYTW